MGRETRPTRPRDSNLAGPPVFCGFSFCDILVWHGYSTVFSPHVYPMNPAWLGGKMPKDMYTHEHPDGPKLRARVSKTFDEDDEEP